jgi:septation ring formation regulator EzrA
MDDKKNYAELKKHCEEEFTSLKSAHYQAMRQFGWSDEEIEKDWERVVEELGGFLNEVHTISDDKEGDPDLSGFDR